jgi:hypothetical protein
MTLSGSPPVRYSPRLGVLVSGCHLPESWSNNSRLSRYGSRARMRREILCSTFRGRDASRRGPGASIKQREVQIQADGGRAAWRVETTRIVCAIFFGPGPPTVSESVATHTSWHTQTSGAERNGRRARDAGRSCRSLPVLEPTIVAWTAVLALSLRARAAR